MRAGGFPQSFGTPILRSAPQADSSLPAISEQARDRRCPAFQLPELHSDEPHRSDRVRQKGGVLIRLLPHGARFPRPSTLELSCAASSRVTGALLYLRE